MINFNKETKEKLFYGGLWFAFSFYLIVLIKQIVFKYSIAQTQMILDNWEWKGILYHIKSANFIPLKSFFTDTTGYLQIVMLLNVIAFVPAGIFVGLLLKKVSIWKTALSGFILSLMLETIQLFTLLGEFDVDDIILNTVGTIIGFLIVVILKKIFERQSRA